MASASVSPPPSPSSSSPSTRFSALNPRDVLILSATRTPIGSFGGSLASLTAPQLGSIAIKSALSKANVKPEMVTECLMGNVLSAGVGQAPCRQAALGASLLPSTCCTTINKVCSSGMKAVMYGAQSIQLSQHDIVVAGGFESMSNVPYLLPKARFGQRLGHGQMLDGLVLDGLTNPYDGAHMGNCGELCSETMKITREQQDAYAMASYQRASEAHKAGVMAKEIVPVEVVTGKSTSVVVEDEDYKNIDFAKMKTLRPVFKPTGTITAANASSLSDGAAALVLASVFSVKKAAGSLVPIAVIRAYADSEQEPQLFPTAPASAVQLALKRANLRVSDIDLWEFNEAFSVVAIANMQLLGLDHSKVNVHGGAVSIGHPLGASGARIITTLINALQTRGGKLGVCGICNGGGGASAIVVELLGPDSLL